MRYRLAHILFTGLTLCLLSLTPVMAQSQDPRTLLHLLDYIGVDYPETVHDGQVVNAPEYAEQQEFAERALTLIGQLPAGAARDMAHQRAIQLTDLIERKAEGPAVSALTQRLRANLIAAYKVTTVPRSTPDPARGAALFDAQCSSCHGLNGAGDGPAATGLEPAPTNFLDRARADQRSLFGLYNTITLGVSDTAMRGFGELSDADRWALAFHVGALAYADAAPRQAGQSLADRDELAPLLDPKTLTATTPAEALAEYGDNGLALLAHLRHDPAGLFADASPFDIAIARLQESATAYAGGSSARAYALALSAYLDGFELAESGLRATAPERVTELETAMLGYRERIKAAIATPEEIQAASNHLVSELEMARELVGDAGLSGSVAMGSAFVILLREGLEALLVLAAIIGILIKTGRRDALPYVHLGWIGALGLGFATWIASLYLVDISGASRELTEGGTALLAAAVLLYVGFWLHDKAHAAQWQAFVKKRIEGALSGRALWALALVAFLAVYREVFETVLFYQALWMQADDGGQQALLGGVGLAGAALLVIGWVILRTSMRLPLNAFFRVNAAIMFLLAVVFAGHGVAGLQEAGTLPIDPVSFPRVDLLGVYPNLESLGAQVLVILLVAGLMIAARRRLGEVSA